jgi:anti-sigma regulatory factor (Ser/Thr protein kinase)
MTLWRQRLRGGAWAARSARRAVRERLRGELSERVLSDVELLVSELATNGVRHGGSRELELEVAVEEDRVCLRMCDEGRGFERRPPRPHPDGSGGYGLVLLDRLSSRWGTERDHAFCVWFEVARRRPAVHP